MATNFHPDLPNDQLHPPKDFSVSNNSSVLTKSDAGILDWNTSPYGTETRITCGPDIAGGLHERKFYVFLDETNKGECYFDVAGETDTHTPIPGYYQIKIDIAANDSAIAIASEIKQEFDRQSGVWSALTTTVDGTGKVTFDGMTNAPDTVDGDTNFTFVNTKTYTGTTVLTSTNGVLSWETGGGGSGTVTAVTAIKPANSTGGTTPEISVDQASGSVDGYLSAANWSTFNNKQSSISLTTNGTSGASTFTGNTLNIPQYTGAAPFSFYEQSHRGWVSKNRGLWIQDSHGTHFDQHTFELRATMTLDQATRGALYYTKAGDRFQSLDGYIEGTSGAVVGLDLYFAPFTCNTTHTNSQNLIARSTVTLSGDRTPICYSLTPTIPSVFTTGVLVFAINLGSNTTANYIHSLKITR